jgi:hypothetical protein
VILFRLLKNAHTQGSSFDRLRINSPEECGVLGRTPQRRKMRETQQMGVFQQPVKGI